MLGNDLRVLAIFTIFAVGAASSSGWFAYHIAGQSLEKAARNTLTLGRETKRRLLEDFFHAVRQEILRDAQRQGQPPTHLGVSSREQWECAQLPDEMPQAVLRSARTACASTAPEATFLTDLVRHQGFTGAFLFTPAPDTVDRRLLVYRIPSATLDRMMLAAADWSSEGFGRSGETYVVGSDGLMRTNSRFAVEDLRGFLAQLTQTPQGIRNAIAATGSTVLMLPVRTEASLAAFSGLTDTRVVQDYRGVKALSAFTPLQIDGVRWALLSEIDHSEAFAAVTELRMNLLLLTAILTLVFLLIGSLLTRAIARPLDHLARRALGLSESLQQRIGHDLHDDLAQQLVGTALLARTTEQALAGKPEANEVQRIAELLDGAIQTTRKLSRGLSPVPVLAHGLGDALTQLAGETEERTGVRTRLHISNAQPALQEDTALHLYRITQEAISNAIRHGGAANIVVTLATTGSECRLTVANDGKPHTPPDSHDGIGLAIMAMRARTLNGTLTIRNRDDGWVEVVCRHPLPRRSP